MGHFSAETHAVATITASREQVWEVLTDPALVARMTPFVKQITEDDGHWVWELSGLKVLGVGVAPTFREQMTYDEPRRIDFHHDPRDGEGERAGVEGWYSLEEADEGCRLETQLRITLELPLPRASGGAVRKAMSSVVDQMGDRFSAHLLDHLGAEQIA